MATVVILSNLQSWLASQPENTPETAYELQIDGIGQIQDPRFAFRTPLLSDDNYKRYVDLSATTLTYNNLDRRERAPFRNSFESLFEDCVNLVRPPVFSMGSEIVYLPSTFKNCTHLIEAPEIPSYASKLSSTFAGCTSLTTPPSLENYKDNILTGTFLGSGITTPPKLPFVPVNFNMSSAFAGCVNLTEPPEIPFNTTSLTFTFDGSGIVKAPVINASGITSIMGCFRNCTNLEYPPTINSNITDVTQAFKGCTSLKYKPIIPSTVTTSTDVYDGVTQTNWGGTESQVNTWAPQQSSSSEVYIVDENVEDNCYDIRDSFYIVDVLTLDDFLNELEENTPESPYRVMMLNITTDVIYNQIICDKLYQASDRYVDLRHSTIPYYSSVSQYYGFLFNGNENVIYPPVLASGITNITSAFNGCTNLKEAPTLPSSITNITSCFAGCVSLTTAPTLPSGLTTMVGAFSGCTSLTETPSMPNTVTTIAGAFNGCTSLEEVTNFSTGLLNMANCFNGCTSLEEVPALPSSVTNMSGTFKDCTALAEAPVIPNSVTNLSNAFENCTIDEAPAIPSGVTAMNGTFKNCKNIEEIELIPSSVTSAEECFMGCSSLVMIDEFLIPLNTLKNNEDFHNMFSGCVSLIQIGYRIDEAEEWHVFKLNFGSSSVERKVFDKNGNATNIPQTSITKSTLTLPIKTDELWFPTSDTGIDELIANILSYKYSYFNKDVLPPNHKSFVLWADDTNYFKTNISMGSEIPVYPTQADLDADLQNLSDGQIVATVDSGSELSLPVNTVESGNLHAVTSNAVNEALSFGFPSVSQVLFAGGNKLTANQSFQMLGAYDYMLINIPFSVPEGYHKEYILTGQVSTSNSIQVRFKLNNIATNWGRTWSGTTFRSIVSSQPFKLTDIVLEPTYNYTSRNGINLYFETDSGSGDAYVYNITITVFAVKD